MQTLFLRCKGRGMRIFLACDSCQHFSADKQPPRSLPAKYVSRMTRCDSNEDTETTGTNRPEMPHPAKWQGAAEDADYLAGVFSIQDRLPELSILLKPEKGMPAL